MVIAGHYIPANAFSPLQLSNLRPKSVLPSGLSSTMNVIFLIQTNLSRNDGLILSAEMRPVTKRRFFHFPPVCGIVLDDRISQEMSINSRLALLEMRLLISLFIWHFDGKLVSEQEPFYEDRFVARRGSLFVSVERRKT